MKYYSILVTCFFLQGLFGQPASPWVVASGGHHGPAGDVYLSGTIGECVIPTLTGAGLAVTQGFQQPASFTVGLEDHRTGRFTVFPNPTSGKISIALAETGDDCALRLLDMLGRVLKEWSPGTVRRLDADVSGLPPGCYWLVLDAGSLGSRQGRLITRL